MRTLTNDFFSCSTIIFNGLTDALRLSGQFFCGVTKNPSGLFGDFLEKLDLQ